MQIGIVFRLELLFGEQGSCQRAAFLWRALGKRILDERRSRKNRGGAVSGAESVEINLQFSLPKECVTQSKEGVDCRSTLERLSVEKLRHVANHLHPLKIHPSHSAASSDTNPSDVFLTAERPRSGCLRLGPKPFGLQSVPRTLPLL